MEKSNQQKMTNDMRLGEVKSEFGILTLKVSSLFIREINHSCNMTFERAWTSSSRELLR